MSPLKHASIHKNSQHVIASKSKNPKFFERSVNPINQELEGFVWPSIHSCAKINFRHDLLIYCLYRNKENHLLP